MLGWYFNELYQSNVLLIRVEREEREVKVQNNKNVSYLCSHRYKGDNYGKGNI